MARQAAATIVSKRYLALARVTAVSFREHHPGTPFFVLLADRADGFLAPGSEPFEWIPLEQLCLSGARRLQFQYNELELSYALTPHWIEHLLERGFDRVLFLKQETLVLGSLEPEFQALREASAVLTPHLLAPPSGPDALRTELNVLRAGVFNGGFLGFSRHPEALAFLRWWKRRTERDCYRDVERGVHFEQRWLDFAPSLMPSCRLVRDPGLNVGHWNLLDRRIEILPGGEILADGRPCRLFRFSGYDPARPDQVTRYNPGLAVVATGAAAEIFRLYHERLIAAGHWTVQRWPYAWACYDDGTPISDAARRIYHDLGEQAERFGDPFRTGPGSFREWLAQPAGGGFPPGVTNFWKYVYAQRRDLQRIFGAARGMAKIFYPLWIHVRGQQQYGEGKR